jgi:hypothetical protein
MLLMGRVAGSVGESGCGALLAPTLEIRAIDEKAFKARLSGSDPIRIAGRRMQEWARATVESSSLLLGMRRIAVPDDPPVPAFRVRDER